MSPVRSVLPTLLVLSACGLPPVDGVDEGARLDAGPADLPSTGLGIRDVARDAGVPSDDVAEGTPLELVAARADFHGWSCLVDGPQGWDATDPCAGDACDYVILELTDSLLGRSADAFCLARSPEGAWLDCEQVWAEAHGEQPGPDAPSVLPAAFAAAGHDQPHQELSATAAIRKVAACSKRPLDLDAELRFAFAPEGLVLSMAGLEHVACAQEDLPGRWGGSWIDGGARVPVDAACMGAEAGPGWQLVRDPGGAYVQATRFVVETAGTGFLADLSVLPAR